MGEKSKTEQFGIGGAFATCIIQCGDRGEIEYIS
jgi:hypothetical protein